jgi:hypothetical protein
LRIAKEFDSFLANVVVSATRMDSTIHYPANDESAVYVAIALISLLLAFMLAESLYLSRAMQKKLIFDSAHLDITISRLCQQLIENHNNFSDTVIIGMQPRGSSWPKSSIKSENQTDIPSAIWMPPSIAMISEDVKFLQGQTTSVLPSRQGSAVDDVLFTGVHSCRDGCYDCLWKTGTVVVSTNRQKTQSGITHLPTMSAKVNTLAQRSGGTGAQEYKQSKSG